jgi:hypothetical protein
MEMNGGLGREYRNKEGRKELKVCIYEGNKISKG